MQESQGGDYSGKSDSYAGQVPDLTTRLKELYPNGFGESFNRIITEGYSAGRYAAGRNLHNGAYSMN